MAETRDEGLSDHTQRPGRAARRIAGLAFAWACAASLILLVAPLKTVEEGTVTSNGHGEEVVTTSRRSLLEDEGAGIALVLLIPALVALIGFLMRGRAALITRLAAGVLLLVFSLVGAASIGLFYVPAAVLLVAAGIMTLDRPADAPDS